MASSSSSAPAGEAGAAPEEAVAGTCRICLDDVYVYDEDGVTPCDCMENGQLAVAHRSCVQQWIRLRPNIPRSEAQPRLPGRSEGESPAAPASDAGACEVCGARWRQPYEMPSEDEPEMSQQEFDDRAQIMLSMAYLRTLGAGGRVADEADHTLVRVLGQYYDGPWRKAPSLAQRLSTGVRGAGHGLRRRFRPLLRKLGASDARFYE